MRVKFKAVTALFTAGILTLITTSCSAPSTTGKTLPYEPVTIENFLAGLKRDVTGAPFADLDLNKDGKLTGAEFTNGHSYIFNHVDRNYDGMLSAREFKAYPNIQKKLVTEKEKIPAGTRVYHDIPYAGTAYARQYLDIFLPAKTDTSGPLPLVIWVHGGGWQNGSKNHTGWQTELLNKGFALAAINYRSTRQAPYPAQLDDCKAALRFLRKYAADFDIDPDNIGFWGSSAGGHLVALMGTTGNEQAYEGSVGVTGVSTKVQAVLDWYGPTEMFKMYDLLASQQPQGADLSGFPVPKLFSGMPGDKDALIRAGSPLFQVDADNPPFMIMHADKDAVVPLEQSQLLYDELKRHNVPAQLHIVDMDDHAHFKGQKEQDMAHDFFMRTLKREQD